MATNIGLSIIFYKNSVFFTSIDKFTASYLARILSKRKFMFIRSISRELFGWKFSHLKFILSIQYAFFAVHGFSSFLTKSYVVNFSTFWHIHSIFSLICGTYTRKLVSLNIPWFLHLNYKCLRVISLFPLTTSFLSSIFYGIFVLLLNQIAKLYLHLLLLDSHPLTCDTWFMILDLWPQTFHVHNSLIIPPLRWSGVFMSQILLMIHRVTCIPIYVIDATQLPFRALMITVCIKLIGCPVKAFNYYDYHHHSIYFLFLIFRSLLV